MILRIILLAFSWLLLAAHFSRADMLILTIASLLIPFILLLKKKWALIAVTVLTIAGSLEWIRTTLEIIKIREAMGESWTRMAIILFSVAAFTLFSAIYLYTAKSKFK